VRQLSGEPSLENPFSFSRCKRPYHGDSITRR
jgi:hypothetical protein